MTPEIDEHIIDALKENARTPFVTIAKQCETTEGTIRNRVAKLVEKGRIKKFTLELEHNTRAIVGLQVNANTSTKEIVEELKKLKLEKVYQVTGTYDIITMIPYNASKKENGVIEKIRMMNGVDTVEVFTVLGEY